MIQNWILYAGFARNPPLTGVYIYIYIYMYICMVPCSVLLPPPPPNMVWVPPGPYSPTPPRPPELAPRHPGTPTLVRQPTKHIKQVVLFSAVVWSSNSWPDSSSAAHDGTCQTGLSIAINHSPKRTPRIMCADVAIRRVRSRFFSAVQVFCYMEPGGSTTMPRLNTTASTMRLQDGRGGHVARITRSRFVRLSCKVQEHLAAKAEQVVCAFELIWACILLEGTPKGKPPFCGQKEAPVCERKSARLKEATPC